MCIKNIVFFQLNSNVGTLNFSLFILLEQRRRRWRQESEKQLKMLQILQSRALASLKINKHKKL